jgi:hypothetical protein
VDEQARRYAPQLAHAEQVAAWSECGAVVAVFSAQAGGGVRTSAYVKGLLPLAGIPALIGGAAIGFPDILPLIVVYPFFAGAWFGVSMWRGREPRRAVWLYAFTGGFVLLDDTRAPVVPVRWSQVTAVSEVWSDVYNVSAEETRPALTGYRLLLADGQAREISRAFRNVRDPYREVGQLLRGMVPSVLGPTMPTFPSVDEIIATYAGRPA